VCVDPRTSYIRLGQDFTFEKAWRRGSVSPSLISTTGTRPPYGVISYYSAQMIRLLLCPPSSALVWAAGSLRMGMSSKVERDLAESWGTSCFRIRASMRSRASIHNANCGREGDLESLCSLTAIEKTLLPFFLKKNPDHTLNTLGACGRPRNSCGDWPKLGTHMQRYFPCAGPGSWSVF
jgi:hypothetical protein